MLRKRNPGARHDAPFRFTRMAARSMASAIPASGRPLPRWIKTAQGGDVTAVNGPIRSCGATPSTNVAARQTLAAKCKTLGRPTDTAGICDSGWTDASLMERPFRPCLGVRSLN